MKKILCLFLIIFSTSVNAEWTLIGSGSSHVVYVDLSTKKKIENNIRIWELLDYKSPESVDNYPSYLSSKVLHEYHCRQDSHRIISSVHYSLNMGSGDVIHSSSVNSGWNYVVPGTVGETVFNFVCKK